MSEIGHEAGPKPHFGLDGIDHVLLIVNGMERALKFYEGVLGCTLEARYPQWGMAQLRAGTALINLVDTAVANGAWAKPDTAGGRNMDHTASRSAHMTSRHSATISPGMGSGSSKNPGTQERAARACRSMSAIRRATPSN